MPSIRAALRPKGFGSSSRGPANYAATTDASGIARFESIAAGRYDVFILAGQSEAWTLHDELEIVERTGRPVERTVTVGRATLRGYVAVDREARCTVRAMLHGDRYMEVGVGRDGNFEMPGAVPGSYHLEYRVRKHRSSLVVASKAHVSGTDDDRPLFAALSELVQVVVRISDRAGRPIPGVEVRYEHACSGESENQDSNESADHRSDESVHRARDRDRGRRVRARPTRAQVQRSAPRASSTAWFGPVAGGCA